MTATSTLTRLEVIYPELGETTTAEVEFKCSVLGGYYVTTDHQLKGRGIRQCGDGSSHKRGKKTFQVTESAMRILKLKYTCCYLASL